MYLFAFPFERGLYCDDQSIRYPYKHSTVPSWTLYVVGLMLPVVLMALNELWIEQTDSVGKPVSFCSMDFQSWFWRTYASVGPFLFACACSQLLTDIAKYSIGRLRPHFLDICDPPDYISNVFNCSHYYIDKIPCNNAGDNYWRVKDARLSFPSGHASFSAVTMIYLVIYLNQRFRIQTPRLVRPFLQFICLLLTFYTSLSRISDYKHHWSDVLCGFALGASVAIFVAFYVSDLMSTSFSIPTTSRGRAIVLHEMERHQSEENNVQVIE